jgi:hypothetical protein
MLHKQFLVFDIVAHGKLASLQTAEFIGETGVTKGDEL